MEIYQASEKYLQLREELDNLNRGQYAEEHVWRVKYVDHVEGYYLLLHPLIGDFMSEKVCDAASSSKWQQLRYITKQRGGTRYFKTLDAVARALVQIGQRVLPLEHLDNLE